MVTVIIPAYNRPEDLEQALGSLVIQTYKEFKVLVSDDASTEDLHPTCNKFKGKLDIKYVKNKSNLGCGGNRRAALTYFFNNKPTDYLMFLDSDDLLLPQALARLTDAINHNKADLISTDILNESRGPIQQIIEAGKNKTWLHGKIYRTQFLIDHNINFCKDLPTDEDLSFNLSIYAYNPQAYILHEQLYLWRANPNSLTRSKNTRKLNQLCNSVNYIEAIYRAFLHFQKEKVPLIPEIVADVFKCYEYFQNGLIFKTMEPKYEDMMREMLMCEQIQDAAVSLYKRPDISLSFGQYVIYENSMVFYKASFGTWLMNFYTPDVIQAAIRRVEGKDKKI